MPPEERERAEQRDQSLAAKRGVTVAALRRARAEQPQLAGVLRRWLPGIGLQMKVRNWHSQRWVPVGQTAAAGEEAWWPEARELELTVELRARTKREGSSLGYDELKRLLAAALGLTPVRKRAQVAVPGVATPELNRALEHVARLLWTTVRIYPRRAARGLRMLTESSVPTGPEADTESSVQAGAELVADPSAEPGTEPGAGRSETERLLAAFQRVVDDGSGIEDALQRVGVAETEFESQGRGGFKTRPYDADRPYDARIEGSAGTDAGFHEDGAEGVAESGDEFESQGRGGFKTRPYDAKIETRPYDAKIQTRPCDADRPYDARIGDSGGTDAGFHEDGAQSSDETADEFKTEFESQGRGGFKTRPYDADRPYDARIEGSAGTDAGFHEDGAQSSDEAADEFKTEFESQGRGGFETRPYDARIETRPYDARIEGSAGTDAGFHEDGAEGVAETADEFETEFESQGRGGFKTRPYDAKIKTRPYDAKIETRPYDAKIETRPCDADRPYDAEIGRGAGFEGYEARALREFEEGTEALQEFESEVASRTRPYKLYVAFGRLLAAMYGDLPEFDAFRPRGQFNEETVMHLEA